MSDIGFSKTRLTGISFLNEQGEHITLSVGDRIEYADSYRSGRDSALPVIADAQIIQIGWNRVPDCPLFTIDDGNEERVLFPESIIRKL